MENELSRITLEQADGTWIAAAAGRVDKDGLSANCEARDSDPLTAMTLLARTLHLALQEAQAHNDFEHGFTDLNDPRFNSVSM
jgi:hypothetical protein